MKILRLKAKGFIGFKKGLDLQEIDIDFSKVSGLCALDGRNGAGKTTCLELLSPYRTLASRKGALQHHVYLRDSMKELTFEFNGNTYRCLIKIDSQSGKQEGFIYKNGSTASEVDGKTPEYDKYITDLLGSSNLFFNSIFCSQNSDKISDLTTGELKALFSEFLQLDKLVEYENTAKQCGIILNGKIDTINKTIFNLSDTGTKLNMAKEEMRESGQILNKKNINLSTLKENLLNSEKQLQADQKIIEDNRVLESRLEENQNKLEILELDINEEEVAFKGDSNDLKDKLDDVNGKINDLNQTLADKDKIEQAVKDDSSIRDAIELTQGRIDALGKLADKISLEINDLKNDKSNWENIIKKETELVQDRISKILKQAEESFNSLQDKRTKKTELEQNIRDLEKDVKSQTILQQIKNLEDQTKTLELRQLDEGCTAKDAVCNFVKNAVEARNKLPGLKAELKNHLINVKDTKEGLQKELSFVNDQIKTNEEEWNKYKQAIDTEKQSLEEYKKGINKNIETIDAQIKISEQDLAGEKKNIEFEQKALQDLKKRLADLKPLLDQKDSMLTASANLESLSKQKEDITAQQDSVNKKHADKSADLNKRMANIKVLIKELEEGIDKEAKQRYCNTEKNIKSTKEQIDQVEKSIVSCETDIKITEKVIQDLEKDLETWKEAEQQKEKYTKEATEWAYLKGALSKDGLRALEIDSVAPAISAYANELLNKTFGPAFSVRFRTQDEETGREVLDIIVIRDDGTEVLLDNLSGGQKVWILKSLRLAMTLISKEKSGKSFKTILCDEEDGALSKDNAVNFIMLYRSLLDMAGMDTCFYISHRQEAIDMADYRVVFYNDGIEVE